MPTPILNNDTFGPFIDSNFDWIAPVTPMTDEEQLIWSRRIMQEVEIQLQNEIDEETEFYNRLDNLINTKSKNELSPFGLHASLSAHKYPDARRRIKNFFQDTNDRYAYFGSSSGDARSHNLFRCTNGKIYVVHSAYGDLDIFYLSKGELIHYFDEEPDEMPDFDDPQDVLDLLSEIDNQNDINEQETSDIDICSQDSTPRRIID